MGGKFTPVLHQMRELWDDDVKWNFKRGNNASGFVMKH